MISLISKGAEIDALDDAFNTPLYMAALSRNYEAVNLLVDYGARVDLRNKFGNNVLHAALLDTSMEIAELLASVVENVDAADGFGKTAFILACEHGYEPVIMQLIARRASIDVQDLSGMTGLLRALTTNREDIALKVLDNRADASIADALGNTPLHLACAQFQPRIVKRLLDQSIVKFDSKNKDGRTPLFFAVENGFEFAVKLLLAKGADVRKLNVDGTTALHLAVATDNDAMLLKLLANDRIQINARDYAFETALISALKTNRLQAAVTLINNNANVLIPDRIGDNGFHVTCYQNQTTILSLLCERHPSLMNYANRRGETPLFYAVKKKLVNMVEMLLANGAAVNKASNTGLTPLHVTTQVNIAKLLCSIKGIKIDARDAKAQTPLFHAVHYGRLRMVEFLLSKGANQKLCASGGVSMLELKCTSKNITDVLAQYFPGTKLSWFEKFRCQIGVHSAIFP